MLSLRCLRRSVLLLGLCSTLPASLAAAEPPAKKAVVNAADSQEVIQVLAIASVSDLELAALIRSRSNDLALLELAQAIDFGFRASLRDFEVLAAAQGIGLGAAAWGPTAQLVKTNVDRDVQILAQKPDAEFQKATLDILFYQFQRMIKIAQEVQELNEDAALKAAIFRFQSTTTRLLGLVEKLRPAS